MKVRKGWSVHFDVDVIPRDDHLPPNGTDLNLDVDDAE